MGIIGDIPFVNLRDRSAWIDIDQKWARYREFLSRSQDLLATNTYQFAVASWHHDTNDPRGLHDATVVSVQFNLLPDDRRFLCLILLNRAETHRIVLRYTNVHEFEISYDRSCHGHGAEDLLIDEIGLSENLKATHTLVFASGKTWHVEFDDVQVDFEQMDE